MLKTFVLAETISTVASTNTSSNTAQSSQAAKTATVTDSSYKDENISINLTETKVNNTQVYVADITVSSSDYLKTAFAQNSFGTNVTAKTSVTAADNDAILAVNGDYYGANSSGYVIRNGVVYRDTVRENSNNGEASLVVGHTNAVWKAKNTLMFGENNKINEGANNSFVGGESSEVNGKNSFAFGNKVSISLKKVLISCSTFSVSPSSSRMMLTPNSSPLRTTVPS